jgi:tetratricopeptide (TPR) repeat protein
MIERLLEAERALEMGRVDAAATMYQQVADADPRNAIAVVGLARVALERGDEAGALELARRALTIDPENAAAGRMVTRLEEVISYRGADIPGTAAVPGPAGEGASAAEAALEVTGVAPLAAPEIVPAAEPPPIEPAPIQPQPAPSQTMAPSREPTPAPPPARRRSWLDRLLRRGR